MSDHTSPPVQLHKIGEGTFLFCSPQGNILFGCPPEVLKRILSSHLPMPDTVVVPEKLEHMHSSQASLEFPLYHFLFVQRGLDRHRRFQVVALPEQCKGLAELLRVTVVGPTDKEMTESGTPAKVAKELFGETTYMSLKNPENGNKPYRVEEMINFFPMQAKEHVEVYAQQDKLPAVYVERQGGAAYRVLYGEDAYDIDMAVSAEQVPNYTIKHKHFDRSTGKFTAVVLGRSNGFDPKDPANGYVLNVDGKVVLWDCPAYLHQHLKALKLDPKDIDAFILSHVHEDHLDAAESLRDPPFELYATPEVYYSLRVKLAAVYGCTPEEARKFHNWHPIDMAQPRMEIVPGATFDFFHSVHAIPALGVRIEKQVNGRRGLLHISGDHLARAALDTMLEAKGISKKRYEEVTHLLNGEETLVLIDAGGGAIHGDYHDYLSYPGRIAYMHTGLIQEELPPGHELAQSGQVLDVLG
ncbi:MAG TPA: MBL fold metallo-hydrolase [bacterium]|nr:MBL fold metallo-hydrolase [bacterium]